MMTFNVRHGTANDGPDDWRERGADLLNFLSSNPVDIVLLQETVATQVREIRDALPQHAAVTTGREDGRWLGEHVPMTLNPDDPTGTSNGFNPERIHGRPIDFIYTSPGFKVGSSEIVLKKTSSGRWLSDHFPVRGLLRLERINVSSSATPSVP